LGTSSIDSADRPAAGSIQLRAQSIAQTRMKIKEGGRRRRDESEDDEHEPAAMARAAWLLVSARSGGRAAAVPPPPPLGLLRPSAVTRGRRGRRREEESQRSEPPTRRTGRATNPGSVRVRPRGCFREADHRSRVESSRVVSPRPGHGFLLLRPAWVGWSSRPGWERTDEIFLSPEIGLVMGQERGP
jgi:hypothetical protein